MRRRLETREIEEEEEEEKICRICHEPGDSKNPLQYPCACSGSIKFVHPRCLIHWMKQQITFKCEVCKHRYSVHHVYAENTPTRLRVCVTVFYKLLVQPLLAFWLWRLGYAWGDIPSRALKLVHTRMSPSTVIMDWLCGIGYVLVMTSIVKAFWRGFDALIREFENDAKDGVHVAVLANNRNHIAVEIGEDAGEQQAIAGVVNVDIVTLWSRLQVAFLRFVIRLVVILRVIRLDVPLRKTCIQLVKDIEFFLVTNGLLILVPLSLGQIIMHCLSRLFFAVSPIVMLFIESAFYIGNNLLKNASHAVANVSVEIQNDYLLSCAVEVVAETLSANSTGPGEALSSGDKPQLVYRSSGLHDVIALAFGYMAIVSLVFVCLGIPFRTIASMIRYYLRKILTTMIYPFFLIIHLVVLPLAYGWWLDVCTSLMLGKSFSDRVDFFSKFPFLSSSMHWTVGIIYMFQIHISTSLLQRVLRKEVRHFRQDLADPIYITSLVLAEDVQVHASQFLYSIAINGILVVFLVYLPVVLAMRLAPTIFPLHICVSDPFTQIPVVMILLQICLPYATELRETVEALLHQWVTSVRYVLGLSGFFCSRPEDIGGLDNMNVERRQDRLHIANAYTFVLRVVLFVVLAWITFLLFSSSLIIVSIPLGRVLYSTISNLPILQGTKRNDLYTLFVGNLSIWSCFTGVRCFIEHFKAGKAHLRFSDICKLFCIIVQSCVLLSLWIIVIPVLIGLLFEFSFLVVEAPVLLLCQDWAVGFFFFKLWGTLVLLNHRIVLVDESWRIKFERVRDNDFLKLPGRWMLQEILIPIIMNLLMCLCLSYVFARWIVPSLGFSLTVNSTVYQFTWVANVTIIALVLCAKRFPT